MYRQTLRTIGWLAIAMLAPLMATAEARDSDKSRIDVTAPMTHVTADGVQRPNMTSNKGDQLAQEHPAPAAEVAPQRKVVLISRIKVRAGRGNELESAIHEFYGKVREAEPGCLVNVMYRPAPPPGRTEGGGGGFALSSAQADTFTFYEVYADAAAAAGHTKTPHFQALMAKLNGITDGKIELEFLDELDAK